MFRYRLRTLLIVITIAAAWAALCRRQADYHWREAERVIANPSMYPRELKSWTELLGSDRARSYTNPALGQLAMNSDIRLILDHQATAKAYQHAAWRPWILLFARPPSPPKKSN